ncbi:MAG: CPBP family glutamic-type intramembrane protease [Microgenomates group bacterium]
MQSTKTNLDSNVIFFPLLILVFVLWILYRSLFTFPVWFDESIGKALFFGLPVWIYITITKNKSISETFAPYKLQSGLLLGIAVGGIFGFTVSILSLLQRGAVVEAVLLFESPIFWREFLLAMLTAFWETMLFFSFVVTVLEEKFANWSSALLVFVSGLIFLAFHLPNAILRFEGPDILSQGLLLLLFAIGQGYLFIGRKNAYALVLSHTIWGLVLVFHAF